MKILIRHERNASAYIYSGIASAFRMLGHEVCFWYEEAGNTPAFDIFDKFEPDFFIGQGYNLNRATIKCIKLRPDIKVLLKVGCWGPVCKDVDTEKYPILMNTAEEIKNVEQVSEAVKELVLFNYVHPNRKDYLMGSWENIASKTIGILPAADAQEYSKGEFDERLKCDVAFVGGYWPYKGQNLDKYIVPLCYPVGKYNVKIFGNQAWPVSQYMGAASNKTVRDLFSSALICPNVSEPHANVFGFEVNERVFKLAASGAFFISDPIASLTEDIFTKGEAVVAEDEKEFMDLVRDIIKNPDTRKTHIRECKETVLNNHTYDHRTKQIMESFGLENE